MPVPGPIMMTGVAGSAGRREAVRLLHIDTKLIAGIDAFRQKRRGQPEALALADVVAHASTVSDSFAGRGAGDEEIE